MMKTRFWMFAFLGVLLFSACKTAQVQLDRQDTGDMDVYPVKGRNGWRWKRHVTAGEFSAENFRGGWVSSYEFPFFVRFRGSKEKFSFVQYDGARNQAVLMAVDRFKAVDVPVVREYFHVPVSYEESFAGSVYLTERRKSYDFWLNYPDANTRITPTEGFINTPFGRVEIRGLQQLEGMKFKLPGNLGYNFIFQQQVVATVDAMNNGMIYLRKDLDPEMRLVLVTVANALLQRTQ